MALLITGLMRHAQNQTANENRRRQVVRALPGELRDSVGPGGEGVAPNQVSEV